MIISHKHQFIFIKTKKKTAGTSIEISLSRYCEANDILTKISPKDEDLRKSLGKQAQNENGIFFNHMPAKKIKEIVGEIVWDSYYKFCFDRNPWDKVISFYYFTCNPNKISFDEFIKSGKFKGAYNYPLYTMDNEVIVDFVGKYESLDEDLLRVTKEIGIPFDSWLPRAKGNARKDRRHYRNVYSDEHKEIVQQYYSKEIELHGYKF